MLCTLLRPTVGIGTYPVALDAAVLVGFAAVGLAGATYVFKRRSNDSRGGRRHGATTIIG